MPNRSTIVVNIAALSLLFSFVAEHLYRHVLRFPSPSILVDLEFGLTPKSQSFRLFAARPLARSAHPVRFNKAAAPFDGAISWKGSRSTIANFLIETDTRAFLVIQKRFFAAQTMKFRVHRPKGCPA